MSSINDILAGVQRARRALQGTLEREALRMGADAAALVENRIVSAGRTADGGALTPYSSKKVPAFFYLGRSRNNAGEQAVRRKMKKREGISYREFRQLNGLNVSHKNLEFTGEMWQGFGVKEVRRPAPGVYVVTLGGKTERTSKLLGYHSAREKTDITKPSAQELTQISAALRARLQSILNNV